MSPKNEEMLDIMLYIDTVGACVEASIFLDPTLLEHKRLQYPYLSWARVARSIMVRSLSVSLIGGGRSSNTSFFPDCWQPWWVLPQYELPGMFFFPRHLTKYCVDSSSECSVTFNSLASSCRWSMPDILWHPVAILRASFCAYWVFWYLVSRRFGIQTGAA